MKPLTSTFNKLNTIRKTKEPASWLVTRIISRRRQGLYEDETLDVCSYYSLIERRAETQF